MPVPEEGYDLRYDVYVSAFEKKAVYMMLVAQYPPFMNESYVEESLESFLNGLVMQNQDNKLIFADITVVQGYKALDFFIDSVVDSSSIDLLFLYLQYYFLVPFILKLKS